MRKRRRPISREMRGEEVVSKRFCGDHLKKLGEAYAIFNMMALQKSPDLYTGGGVLNSSALRGKGFFYKGNVKNVELEIGIPHCIFEAVMVDFLQGRMERVVGIMRGLFLICQCWYMRDPFKMFPLVVGMMMMMYALNSCECPKQKTTTMHAHCTLCMK